MKTQWMLQITTANLPENQESKQACLRGTCTLFNSKKLDDKSTQQKHPEQHGKNIYSRTLCILTHLDTKKTAKVCYSKCGIYRLKSDNYYFSDNGIPNLIFLGNKLLWSSQSRNSSSSHKRDSQHRVCWCFLGLSRQSKVKATSPILSNEAPPDIATVARQDKHSQGIHIQHQGASNSLLELRLQANLGEIDSDSKPEIFFPI